MIGGRGLVWLTWLTVACAGASGRGAPEAGPDARADVSIEDDAAGDTPSPEADAPGLPEPAAEVADAPEPDEAADVPPRPDVAPDTDASDGDQAPDGADVDLPPDLPPESRAQDASDVSDGHDAGDEGLDAPGEALDAVEQGADDTATEPAPEPEPDVAQEAPSEVFDEPGEESVADADTDGEIVASDASEDTGGPPAFPACPVYAPPVTTGLVLNPAVKEASGVVESRRSPGMLWVHNDSGDLPRLYALLNSGAAEGTFTLAGAAVRDWEDLALGPGPVQGQSYLYVGDVGDNGSTRPNVTVYRVAEPPLTPTLYPPALTLTGVEAFTLAYPDQPHNAETLLVDPLSGDLYIVVKAGSGVSPVFRAAAPLATDAPITLEQVATLYFGAAPLAGSTLTTGGDVSPSGDAVVIRTYSSAYLWRRAPGATLAEALATEPCPLPLASEGQGEALGFAADGRGYYTVSEGALVPISFYGQE